MKTTVDRWLDMEISTPKLLSEFRVPYAQGSELIGSIWQSIRQRAYALDAELDRKTAVANAFRAKAMAGDLETAVKSDIHDEAIRAAAFAEARGLLRLHLLGRIDRTEAGA